MPLADTRVVGCGVGLPYTTAQTSQNLMAVCEPWAIAYACGYARIGRLIVCIYSLRPGATLHYR